MFSELQILLVQHFHNELNENLPFYNDDLLKTDAYDMYTMFTGLGT
jgi:hypothetical protein